MTQSWTYNENIRILFWGLILEEQKKRVKQFFPSILCDISNQKACYKNHKYIYFLILNQIFKRYHSKYTTIDRPPVLISEATASKILKKKVEYIESHTY